MLVSGNRRTPQLVLIQMLHCVASVFLRVIHPSGSCSFCKTFSRRKGISKRSRPTTVVSVYFVNIHCSLSHFIFAHYASYIKWQMKNWNYTRENCEDWVKRVSWSSWMNNGEWKEWSTGKKNSLTTLIHTHCMPEIFQCHENSLVDLCCGVCAFLSVLTHTPRQHFWVKWELTTTATAKRTTMNKLS